MFTFFEITGRIAYHPVAKRGTLNRNQYSGKKRQLELERKKKAEEKAKRKLDRKNGIIAPDGYNDVPEEASGEEPAEAPDSDIPDSEPTPESPDEGQTPPV
jgi:hypothetical protein